jgi:O-acetyl-ADP-ribose deacetylase (regulator of RNase III)
MSAVRTPGRIVITVGDITREAVDAIVNAANSTLLGGGGVDGAIHRAAGPDLLEACRRLRMTAYPDGLATGEAAITPGGRLPAKFVVHTVGPIHGRHRGEEARLLASCYEKSLALAAANGARSVAFPAISTGVYGYPKAEAARVARAAIERSLARHPEIDEVRIVCFSEEDARIAREAIGG